MDVDLKESEMDYIRRRYPDVAHHMDQILNEMNIKKQNLFQCLNTILSKLPTVLLNLILDYDIVI